MNEKNLKKNFLDATASAIGSALSELTGKDIDMRPTDKPKEAAARNMPFRCRLKLQGALVGEAWVELDLWELGVLTSEQKEGDDQGEARQAKKLLEALRTSIGIVPDAMASQCGKFTIDIESVTETPGTAGELSWFLANSADGTRSTVVLYSDPALLAALTSAAAPASPPAIAVPGKVATDPTNLSLILDVELNVTLRFGRRQLSLREVLDLTSGSVVELDRQVDEPVELLLDGRVIARGEAVVVDGNYGLRVTEVPQQVTSQMVN
jgi:flagellar motor switch protein FliN/FliY